MAVVVPVAKTGAVTTPVLTVALTQTGATALTGYAIAIALTPPALRGRVTDQLKDR